MAISPSLLKQRALRPRRTPLFLSAESNGQAVWRTGLVTIFQTERVAALVCLGPPRLSLRGNQSHWNFEFHEDPSVWYDEEARSFRFTTVHSAAFDVRPKAATSQFRRPRFPRVS